VKHSKWMLPVVLLGGMLFGFGLGYSRMTQPEVVLSFLQLRDFGLLWVMGVGAGVAGIAFHLASRSGRRAPLTGTHYELRKPLLNKDILVGGAIFGVGWGLSGICPGAAYASVGTGNWPILIGIAGMFAGAYALRWWQSRTLA